jgi:hypothetical protein
VKLVDFVTSEPEKTVGGETPRTPTVEPARRADRSAPGWKHLRNVATALGAKAANPAAKVSKAVLAPALAQEFLAANDALEWYALVFEKGLAWLAGRPARRRRSLSEDGA